MADRRFSWMRNRVLGCFILLAVFGIGFASHYVEEFNEGSKRYLLASAPEAVSRHDQGIKQVEATERERERERSLALSKKYSQ